LGIRLIKYKFLNSIAKTHRISGISVKLYQNKTLARLVFSPLNRREKKKVTKDEICSLYIFMSVLGAKIKDED